MYQVVETELDSVVFKYNNEKAYELGKANSCVEKACKDLMSYLPSHCLASLDWSITGDIELEKKWLYVTIKAISNTDYFKYEKGLKVVDNKVIAL